VIRFLNYRNEKFFAYPVAEILKAYPCLEEADIPQALKCAAWRMEDDKFFIMIGDKYGED